MVANTAPGEAAYTLATRLANAASGRGVCIIGDSVTAQNTDETPTSLAYRSRGYFTAANILLGMPFTLLKNGGASSETAAQIVARIPTDVLPYRPSICVILAGQNDVVSADSTISTLATGYELMRRNGIFVVACTLMPGTSDSATTLARKAGVNRGIREYVANNPGIAIADFAMAMTDPATGLMYSDSTIDTVHPNARGAMRLGRCLADVLSPFVPPPIAPVAFDRDYLNYAYNPFVAGNNASGTNNWVVGSGVTGNGPSGWSANKRGTGAGTTSKASRSGSWRTDGFARMVATFSASYDGAGFYFGGDEFNAKGRYDQPRVNSTAYALGDRRNPATSNGYTYLCVGAGTSASSEPAMSTTEGATVTDGTVTWLVQRKPVAGDVFVAECDVDLSSAVSSKGLCPVLQLSVINTAATEIAGATCNHFGLSGEDGVGSDYAPSSIRLRTPALTIPSFGANALRYLRATVFLYGEASGGATMDVSRAAIRRVS